MINYLSFVAVVSANITVDANDVVTGVDIVTLKAALLAAGVTVLVLTTLVAIIPLLLSLRLKVDVFVSILAKLVIVSL